VGATKYAIECATKFVAEQFTQVGTTKFATENFYEVDDAVNISGFTALSSFDEL
jgi:hypothetical protein